MLRWRRWAGLLPVIAAVALMWPLSLGGQFGYVTTHGISMEPRFHTGDLAVVRAASSYRVGDVAAYHNRMLHTVVLHRIVAILDGTYTFKGDNNTWLDAERPTRSQLIGRLWLRVPHGGIWLHRLLNPTLLGLAAFALLATGGATATANRPRRRNRKMSRHAAPGRRPRRIGTSSRPIAAACSVVVAAGALAAAVWTVPATHLRRVTVSHPQTMSLSYVAAVRPSAAYDGTTVTSPAPLFRRVTDAVELRVAHEGPAGTLRVDAELSAPGGWSSLLPLAAAHAVMAGSTTVRFPLDLAAVDHRVQAAGRATGVVTTPVTVTVIARLVDGVGHRFTARFPLSLTTLTLAPVDQASLVATASTATTVVRSEQAVLHLRQLRIGVRSARAVAEVLVVVALLTAAALVAATRRRNSYGEVQQIQRRWRELLLDVEPVSTPTGRPVVDVTSIEALARVAERYELLILHWLRSGVHTYLVHDASTVFRYRIGSTRAVSQERADATATSPQLGR